MLSFLQPNSSNSAHSGFRISRIFPCAVLFLIFAVALNAAGAQDGSAVAGKAASSTATSSTATVTRLRLGVGELGRVGAWNPIGLEASGLPATAEVRLVVSATDARGNECSDTVASVATDDSGRATISSVFMPGRLDGSISLQLLAGDESLLWSHSVKCEPLGDFTLPDPPTEIPAVQSRLKLATYEPTILVTVGIPSGLTSLANELAAGESTGHAFVVAPVDSLAELPDSRRGLGTVDFLYIVNVYVI